MQKQRDVHKMAIYSIVINIVQIVMVLAMCVLVFFERDLHLNPTVLHMLLVISMVIVSYGAIMDIREAFGAMQTNRHVDMLQDAYAQLEHLNNTLRAQRHDFMNHLQVVHGLIEMQEHEEAADYIEQIYQSIQSVNRVLRTQNPAVNALLQAKLAVCEERGIEMHLEIHSAWADLPMPGWEMCKVLGNLIDNAMDALANVTNPQLTVTLWEDMRSYGFRVHNNGPAIPKEVQEKLLMPGFTTKETGQGMGLYIVDTLLHQYEGVFHIGSSDGSTSFEAHLPRSAGSPQDMRMKNS